MRFWFIIWVCLAWPSASDAGPWLRAEGSGFFSASTKVDKDLRADHSLYLEYGLQPKTTIAAKIEATSLANELINPSILVFARRPLGPTDRPMRYAYDIGAGIRDDATFARLGFSLGRGITLGKRPGWAVLDTSLDLGPLSRVKADATVGLTLNEHWKVMMQAFYTYENDQSDLTLAPSAIWQPKAKAPSYQIGIESTKDQSALRLGLWLEF